MSLAVQEDTKNWINLLKFAVFVAIFTVTYLRYPPYSGLLSMIIAYFQLFCT